MYIGFLNFTVSYLTNCEGRSR